MLWRVTLVAAGGLSLPPKASQILAVGKGLPFISKPSEQKPLPPVRSFYTRSWHLDQHPSVLVTLEARQLESVPTFSNPLEPFTSANPKAVHLTFPAVTTNKYSCLSLTLTPTPHWPWCLLCDHALCVTPWCLGSVRKDILRVALYPHGSILGLSNSWALLKCYPSNLAPLCFSCLTACIRYSLEFPYTMCLSLQCPVVTVPPHMLASI